MTPAAGAVYLPTYEIDLELPGGISLNRLEVMGARLGVQGIGFLIGMDVVTLGHFSVSCDGGRTRLSFCIGNED